MKIYLMRYFFNHISFNVFMENFNSLEMEQEFACSAFKSAITNNDWTKEQLIDLLIQQKKSHIAEINILLWHLKTHGIIASLIHVERGGPNDVQWDFKYLNKFIEKAYNKHIKYLVAHYMVKEIRYE